MSRHVDVSRRLSPKDYAMAGLTALSTVFGSACSIGPSQTEKNPTQASYSTGSGSITEKIVVPEVIKNPLFTDTKASSIAQTLGIDSGSFFLVPEKVVDKLSAYKDPKLFPVFPPAVMARKQLIYDLSREFDIPPNIIAIVMSIESAGSEEAGSGAGAIGLFQPLGDKFEDDVIAIADPAAKLKAMQEPYTNGRAGMKYLKKAIEVSARENGFDIDDVVNYARALISYNAGTGEAGTPFEDLYTETQLYGDHFIRYAVTLEIASKLREAGYKDDQIVKALSSKEIDARSYALGQFLQRTKPDDYKEYMEGLVYVAGQFMSDALPNRKVTEIGRQILKDYKFYLAKPQYSLPLPPGARIWVNAMGGLYLLGFEDINMDPKAWEQLTS